METLKPIPPSRQGKDDLGYATVNTPKGERCGNCAFITYRFKNLSECLRAYGKVDEDKGWCEEYRLDRPAQP